MRAVTSAHVLPLHCEVWEARLCVRNRVATQTEEGSLLSFEYFSDVFCFVLVCNCSLAHSSRQLTKTPFQTNIFPRSSEKLFSVWYLALPSNKPAVDPWKGNSRSVMSNSCDPMDCTRPGSSVHGILQATILEQVAIPFSRGSSWPRDHTCVSYIADRFFTIWATREAQYWIKEELLVIHFSSESYSFRPRVMILAKQGRHIIDLEAVQRSEFILFCWLKLWSVLAWWP